MGSTLELIRGLHEECDRYMKKMADEAVTKKQSVKEQIKSDHRIKQCLNQYHKNVQLLHELYEDKDGERKAEIDALSGPNESNEFYSRLKQVREYHKRHPNEIYVSPSLTVDQTTSLTLAGDSFSYSSASSSAIANASTFLKSYVSNTDCLVDFTDEEGSGKFIDINECFEKYINLKGVDKIDYITYLMTFHRFYDIPKDRKNSEYRKYLQMLYDYLYGFITRIRPLLDMDEILENVEKEFEKQWQEGETPGWPKDQESALTNIGAHLDLSAFSSWEELASLGLDRLKSALMALNLKCGGTLEERAQRLFSTKGKKTLNPTLLARRPLGGGASKLSDSMLLKHKEIALKEAKLYKFAELVTEQRLATKENVQRKQARTDCEREDSDAEISEAETEEDDAEDEVPYNPKNLPLGWDGKPIPYWLYKLHGLNISYNCEICGNFEYKGPKAFQRHFAEWRHAHGMRCLGIPNTAHFANVTHIVDALTLWDKIKIQKQGERWLPDQEEEFEDTLGNVVNKKIYEDLKRQGLL